MLNTGNVSHILPKGSHKFLPVFSTFYGRSRKARYPRYPYYTFGNSTFLQIGASQALIHLKAWSTFSRIFRISRPISITSVLQISSKSVVKESHCSRVTERPQIANTAHALEAMPDWSNSVGNEGHFTFEAESFSSLSRLALQLGDYNITPGTPCRSATIRERLFEIGQSRRTNYSWGGNGFSSESCFAFEVRWLWHQSRHYRHTPYKGYVFGRYPSVTSGTLIVMTKEYFVPI
jgi:hypothetical protein